MNEEQVGNKFVKTICLLIDNECNKYIYEK